MSEDNIVELSNKSKRIWVLNNIEKLIDLTIEFLSDVKDPEISLEGKIAFLEQVEDQISKYLKALRDNE